MVRFLIGGVAAVALASAGIAAQAPAVAGFIKAAVASAERPAEDRARDAARKPAEVLAFAGVKPGMTVVELAPGGGYFTRILSLAVGTTGKVLPVSTQPSTALAEWNATHGNVTMLDLAPPGTIPVTNVEKVGMVWTTLNYHDFKNTKVGDGDAAAAYNAAAFDILQPGGIYLIGDHDAPAGSGATQTSTLHRIEMAQVIKEVEAAGFKLEAQSRLLRHPADPKTGKVFDAGMRGKTDQFLLRFRKPAK